jgi:hypothetical protein
MELEQPASLNVHVEAASSCISVSTNRQICFNAVDGRGLIRNQRMDEPRLSLGHSPICALFGSLAHSKWLRQNECEDNQRDKQRQSFQARKRPVSADYVWTCIIRVKHQK